MPNSQGNGITLSVVSVILSFSNTFLCRQTVTLGLSQGTREEAFREEAFVLSLSSQFLVGRLVLIGLFMLPVLFEKSDSGSRKTMKDGFKK